MNEQNILIDEIHSGVRGRRDPGDLAELAASLQQTGQRHPIVVDSEQRLIAGWRRLTAAREAGLKELRCVQVRTIDEALEAIRPEQTDPLCRQPLTASDAVEIGRSIEALERPRARQKTSQLHQQPGNVVSAPKRDERAREARKPKTVAAKAVGMSRPTYEKAAAVVDAAKENPQVKPVLRELNRTGNVSRAHRQMREIIEAAEQAEAGDPVALQAAIRIGSVVDHFMSVRPAGGRIDVVMAALSESLDRVEKEMIG